MSIRITSGSSARLGYALEELCREILAANGWNIESLESFYVPAIDIIATKSSDRIAFQVKYTRNPTYPTSALLISSERLIESANAIGVNKAVLIVATDIAILNGLWKDTPSGCPSTNQKNLQMI